MFSCCQKNEKLGKILLTKIPMHRETSTKSLRAKGIPIKKIARIAHENLPWTSCREWQLLRPLKISSRRKHCYPSHLVMRSRDRNKKITNAHYFSIVKLTHLACFCVANRRRQISTIFFWYRDEKILLRRSGKCLRNSNVQLKNTLKFYEKFARTVCANFWIFF